MTIRTLGVAIKKRNAFIVTVDVAINLKPIMMNLFIVIPSLSINNYDIYTLNR